MKIKAVILMIMLVIGCAPVSARDSKYSKQQIKDFWSMGVSEYWSKYHPGQTIIDLDEVRDLSKNHKPHGIAYKLTHLGLVHKAATITSSPFYALGFTVACVGGFVAIPFTRAIQDFESRPFVSF